MKNLQLLIVGLFLIFIWSCKNQASQVKSKIELDLNKMTDSLNKEIMEKKYCFEIIKNAPDSLLLKEEEVSRIHELFNQNDLNYDAYQFYRFSFNRVYGDINVRAYKYINGLKLFTDEAIFNFKTDGTFTPFHDNSIPTINLDKEPQTSPNIIISEFIYELSKDDKQALDKDALDQKCYELEFGYYNQNAGTDFKTGRYTKAWLITIKGEQYPYMYMDDTNAAYIYYDNGIRY